MPFIYHVTNALLSVLSAKYPLLYYLYVPPGKLFPFPVIEDNFLSRYDISQGEQTQSWALKEVHLHFCIGCLVVVINQSPKRPILFVCIDPACDDKKQQLK